MPKTALALRHLAFEDLGVVHPLLLERGYDVRYVDVGIDELDPAAITAADVLVVLGGPIGAHDEDRYPFLDTEIAALRARLSDTTQHRKLTLGICLGAQLLARALGADVRPSGHTEIGYAPLTLEPQAHSTPLRHLDGIPVLHWHNDQFEVPESATHLASTPRCAHQAFTAGPDVLALQFHLETDYRGIERWLIGHADALVSAAIHPADLRRAASAAGPALTEAAGRTLADWLDG